MDINVVQIVLYIVVLLFSVIVHEVMHGVVAGWFGDDTAKEAGRLTLNPISHIDPIMSIALPAVLYILHAPVFGAAKPVPVNYNRMTNPRAGLAFVSLAGPISNFVLAGAALALFALHVPSYIPGSDQVLSALFIINIILGVFNFIPIPPLDGSRLIGAILPWKFRNWWLELDRFGFIFIFILLYIGAIDRVLTSAFSVISNLLGVNMQ